jgi:hypothetical protein
MVFIGVTSVGSSAFRESKITGFSAINLLNIDSTAFRDCLFLTTVNTPSLLTIGSSAFQSCGLLNTNFVLNNLNTLGASAFQSSGITGFSANSLQNIFDLTFNSCIELLSFSALLAQTLGANAFYNCNKLTGDLIFNSLTSIGDFTFYLCKITGFVAPNLLTMGDNSLRECSQITNIDIRKITGIGSSNSVDNLVFRNIKIGCLITAPLAMQTINAGAVEPDLLYSKNSKAATIIYI